MTLYYVRVYGQDGTVLYNITQGGILDVEIDVSAHDHVSIDMNGTANGGGYTVLVEGIYF